MVPAIGRQSPAGGQAALHKPPFPYVDGLSFIGNPLDVAVVRVSASINHVSTAERLPTPDGSVRYFRSSDACNRSVNAARKQLADGAVPGAFLATSGRAIRDAYAAGRTAVFFQFQGCEPIGEELWTAGHVPRAGPARAPDHAPQRQSLGRRRDREELDRPDQGRREGVERMNALGIMPDLSHVSEVRRRSTSSSQHEAGHRFARRRAGARDQRALHARRRSSAASPESGGVMGIFMMSMWLTTDPEAHGRALRPADSPRDQRRRHRRRRHRQRLHAGGRTHCGQGGQRQREDHLQLLSRGGTRSRSEGVLGFDTRPPHAVIPELNNVAACFSIQSALERGGSSRHEIEKIMGGNWIRVLTDSLPADTAQ